MSYEEDRIKLRAAETKIIMSIAFKVIGVAMLLITLVMWGCPQYNVYSARKDGEAQLAHAQSSKEVAVAEAKAKMESAMYLKQADSIRAQGIAISNTIIGESLKNNREYLQWLWIDQIEKANTIYIPTEGNLPLMEAGRFNMRRDTLTR